MTRADRLWRTGALLAGAVLGLVLVQGVEAALSQTPEPADERPTWLYDLPAEPAPPADPELPAEPAPLRELPETT